MAGMIRPPSSPGTDRRRTPTVAVAVATVTVLSLSLVRCGADGMEAPPPPILDEGTCQPMAETLSGFFEVLRRPTAPLSGLRDVVVEISRMGEEDCERLRERGLPCQHPVGAVLDAVVRGFVTFSRDPDEGFGTRCLELAPAEGENRLCSLRRALDFGVRDAAASELFDDLLPLMARLIGWISNEGPGANGKTHWEPISVLQEAAANPGLCNPEHLFDSIDSLVTYWRPDATCSASADGDACRSLAALGLLRELVSDPALQDFLKLFATEDGSGRLAFQRVGGLLLSRLSEMPNDARYFDAIDRIANDLLFPFLDNDPAKYGELKGKLVDSLDIARAFLAPHRDGAVLVPFKGVMGCLERVDDDREIIGAAYDLLLKPAEGGPPVDLVEMATLLEEIVRLDSQRHGVLLGAVQTMLRGTRADEQGTEALRKLMVELLTPANARRVFPPLRILIERGVLTEMVLLVDDLLYGCRDAN